MLTAHPHLSPQLCELNPPTHHHHHPMSPPQRSQSVSGGSSRRISSSLRPHKRKSAEHHGLALERMISSSPTVPHYVDPEFHASRMSIQSKSIEHHVTSEFCASKKRLVSCSAQHQVDSEVRASSMRNKSRRVPHNLMLSILSRVPARSLVRLRCVCKLWNSLFRDPYFVRLQLSYASKNPTTFVGYTYMWDRDLVNFFQLEIEANKLVAFDKFTILVEKELNYSMTNACEGLIAFHGNDYNAYVANPSTREWMALPNIIPNWPLCSYSPHNTSDEEACVGSIPSLGLGFSMPTCNYKLAWIYYGGGSPRRWSCAVLTVGIDCSWRPLGEIPYLVETLFSPAYSNGFIYWMVMNADFLLAFNVSREEFVTIRLPPQCLHDPEPYGEEAAYRNFYMSVLEGSMCLVAWRVYLDPQRTSYVPFMNIHVLESHSAIAESEKGDPPVWREGHSLRLRSVKLSQKNRAPKFITMFPTYIQDGKLLLFRRHSLSWRLHDMVSGACTTIKSPEDELKYARFMSRPFTCAASIVPMDQWGCSK